MDRLIRTAAQRLINYPYIGRIGLIPGTRELIPHPNYRIVYTVTDDRIDVHMVVHTSRQWPPEGDA